MNDDDAKFSRKASRIASSSCRCTTTSIGRKRTTETPCLQISSCASECGRKFTCRELQIPSFAPEMTKTGITNCSRNDDGTGLLSRGTFGAKVEEGCRHATTRNLKPRSFCPGQSLPSISSVSTEQWQRGATVRVRHNQPNLR